MNRITPEALYELLPGGQRTRDAEEGEPLRALMGVLAREGAVVEEAIEQLYDNLFVETAEPWAVAYVGGIIGYRPLHPVGGQAAGSRAEVANTIAYRRRKGTVAVLEQLAVDVTGWPAKVVEYFLLVATCQHMNHIRPDHHWGPDLHDPLSLEALGKAFDGVTRSVDVRSIAQSGGRGSIGGRHNLPNIGVHLWRLEVVRHTRTLTTVLNERRHFFDPLGLGTVAPPRRLINRPRPEDAITSLAAPINVPGDITRRGLDADPALWYGPGRSIELYRDGEPVPVEEIEACDLSDDGAAWNHSPPVPLLPDSRIRIDPELGRIAFPLEEDREIRATWHRAFPAKIGGGEYNRARELVTLPGQVPVVVASPAESLQDAIDAVQDNGGIVEIDSSDIFDIPRIDAGVNVEVVLRAADGRRPILRGDADMVVTGAPGARVVLNGLLIEGAGVSVEPDVNGDALNRVTLAHCTLVPGHSYTPSGVPATPGATSLSVTATGVELELRQSITGPLRTLDTTNVTIADGVVDAAAEDPADSPLGLAIGGIGASEQAGAISMDAVTVLGRIFARSFPLVSNTILHARAVDEGIPVRVLRRQEGCVRFSFVPQGSVVPRRHRCQPQLAIEQEIEAATEAAGVAQLPADQRALIASRITRLLIPSFTALSSSHPAYVQLLRSAPTEIRQGASDESEMGAYQHLFQPQRETNLRIRIEEYLRFGLEAGVFYET